MAVIKVVCVHCDTTDGVVKNGKAPSGIQRYTRLKRLTRRTICFSRSEELHDKVIGEFISRMWYQPV